MTTNQRQTESSQVILERIRQKLGITAEVAQEQQGQRNVVQMQQRQPQQRQQDQQQYQQPQQERMQQTFQPQQRQQNQPQQAPQGNFDDNFSFNDLEFNPQAQQGSQERNEINNLLRSYQNNRKNSYNQQETQEQGWNEEAEFEGFEEDGLEQGELDLNEQEYDEYDQEQNEFEQEFGQDEFAEFEDELEQGNTSNVHFLNRVQAHQPQQQIQQEQRTTEQYFNLSHEEEQGNQGEQQERGAKQQYFPLSQEGAQENHKHSELSMQIEQAIHNAVSQCVMEWCEENLESICREVIRDELRKTA